MPWIGPSDIPYIEGLYAIGSGAKKPRVGAHNTRDRGFDIPCLGGLKYHGEGVKIPCLVVSIYHG